MKNRLRSIGRTLIAVFCMWTAFPSGSTGFTGIQWHPYNEGMALGKSKNKKVFINFYADWCGYCKVMDKETFEDPSVISYLNENFISIRVNVDKERMIAARYRINPLPDTWFISEKGEPIGNKPGFVSAKDLLPILKFISTDSYLKMSYKEFLKSF